MYQKIWSISELVEIFTAWQTNKFDGPIIIDGNRGLGKSTLGVKLAKRFPDFKIRKHVAYSREEVIKLLTTMQKGVIIADEMINVTYSRDFWNEQQKDLIKHLNMYRDHGNILICCVPNFYDLDKQIRALVKMRINIVRRGLGVIHMKNQTSFSADKWDLKTNEKRELAWSQKKLFKPQYAKFTTFKGYIKFGDLKKRERELYEQVKTKKRNKILQEKQLDKKTDIYDNIIINIKEGKIINKESLIPIALVNGIKYSTLTHRLNTKLKDLGESMTIGMLIDSKKFNDINSLDQNGKNISARRAI